MNDSTLAIGSSAVCTSQNCVYLNGKYELFPPNNLTWCVSSSTNTWYVVSQGDHVFCNHHSVIDLRQLCCNWMSATCWEHWQFLKHHHLLLLTWSLLPLELRICNHCNTDIDHDYTCLKSDRLRKFNTNTQEDSVSTFHSPTYSTCYSSYKGMDSSSYKGMYSTMHEVEVSSSNTVQLATSPVQTQFGEDNRFILPVWQHHCGSVSLLTGVR